jgi:hypothetical protein
MNSYFLFLRKKSIYETTDGKVFVRFLEHFYFIRPFLSFLQPYRLARNGGFSVNALSKLSIAQLFRFFVVEPNHTGPNNDI